MMVADVTNQVIEIFRTVCNAEHVPLPPQISGNANLMELGLSSLLFIKVVVRLEIEFDVDFDDENMDINSFVVINDIVRYIQEQQA